MKIDYYYDEDSLLVRAEFWAKGVKGIMNRVDYSYDNNGNLIRIVDGLQYPPMARNTGYSYDYENRLIKITTPDATLSFNYCSCPTLTGITGCGECGGQGSADSPSGKRISKTVNDQTISTICFDPTMDFDSNGNIIARYIQNPTVLDEPISIETSQGKFYYLFDGLGSVTGLTDPTLNYFISKPYTLLHEQIYLNKNINARTGIKKNR